MRQILAKIWSQKEVAEGVYLLSFLCRAQKGEIKAGQFCEILVPGFTLRRPFGVFFVRQLSSTRARISLLYRIAGGGTQKLSGLSDKEPLDVLVGLGNGFNTTKGDRPLIIGGGMGIAPLFQLAKELESKKPLIILGFKNEGEAKLAELFTQEGLAVQIATDDGSVGFKGNAFQLFQSLEPDCDYYYGCGPVPMLKALSANMPIDGELSLEARMGCGFGACMGCSIKTTSGYKRVCKEGPVFGAATIIF
jgi:dihydroorotate dehydrogenase electron transfer subunit